MWASPGWSSPVYPSPVYGNPVHGNTTPTLHLNGARAAATPPNVPPFVCAGSGVGAGPRHRLGGAHRVPPAHQPSAGDHPAERSRLRLEDRESERHRVPVTHRGTRHVHPRSRPPNDRQIRFAQSKGAVVVPSAGNDGVRRRALPAALPGVVGVGALGPSGPAPFTKDGNWVRACAPGVDIVSAFFIEFNGPLPRSSATNPTTSWAGRSGAARRSRPQRWRPPSRGKSRGPAAQRRRRSPRSSTRPGGCIPYLGTVVNLVF
jgi:hypothetical protein